MCLVQYELYYLFSDTNIFSQLIGIVVSTPSHHPIISQRTMAAFVIEDKDLAGLKGKVVIVTGMCD